MIVEIKNEEAEQPVAARVPSLAEYPQRPLQKCQNDWETAATASLQTLNIKHDSLITLIKAFSFLFDINPSRG